MAVYRLGDMVRMRRKALGMTQEELVQIYDGKETESQNGGPNASWLRYYGLRQACGMHRDKNEICSVQVLRRIENGGVKRGKIEVFRRLMIKMGVLPERFYASVMVTECSGLRLKTLIHTHMIRKEYQEAEMELQELESVLVPGYPRNEQYLMAIKAKLAWEKGNMTVGEYLEILLKSLRCTVPKLDDIDIAGWPFNRNEFDILIQVANAYHSMNEREKWLEFLLKLKANVEQNYMDWDHYVV